MNFPLKFFSNSETDTHLLAKEFSQTILPGDVIVLNGELGSGKTFFVKKVLENFGITWVNSPSFAIVNEYRNSITFYHIDFYRIKSEAELINTGLYDYLNDKGAVVFIEWGNLFHSVLPQKRIEINIDIQPEDKRLININEYA